MGCSFQICIDALFIRLFLRMFTICEIGSPLSVCDFCSKSFEGSLEDYTPWANRFKELPLYFMTFHGQEDFENVKDVSTLKAI